MFYNKPIFGSSKVVAVVVVVIIVVVSVVIISFVTLFAVEVTIAICY